MKLHIGCGKVYINGWTNVDLFSSCQADLYCDITRLPFEKGSAEIIYASHVLEHVHRHMVLATLQHWREVLEPGGVLRLSVPNFAAVCRCNIQHHDLPTLMGLLYGGQNYPKNSHTVTFDYAYLSDLLYKAGFQTVRYWDWKKTEHTNYDDFSQCFLPHMDKENGTLMSLNLEAL